MSGTKLTGRIRAKAFESLLRQEVAFFDRLENSVGAIYTRLSSDALAIQQLVGAQLGLTCEASAILLVFLIFGFTFSWQLTLIVLIPLSIISIIVYFNVLMEMKVNTRAKNLLQQGSSVRLIYILSI